MGAAQDFRSEGLRRLLVNACYWASDWRAKIPAKSNVDIVGTYDALPMGSGKHKPGVRPADLK